MKHFLCKFIPPRSAFAQDMTEAEKQLMREHVSYRKGLFDQRIAIVFGPVADPRGSLGVGIVEVESEADATALRENDPTIKARRDFKFEIYPMSQAIVRK